MAMKLILRADVDNLGRLGDVVKVKPGFGRNYLIPKGYAMPVTDANLKAFELERRKLQAKMDSIRGAAQSLADKIAGAALSIPVRVGEGDRLYGSVTNAVIAEALAAEGIEVDRRKILLEEPIRALGAYKVPVKLHPDVQVELSVSVVRFGAAPEEEAEAAPEEAEAEAEAEEPAVEE